MVTPNPPSPSSLPSQQVPHTSSSNSGFSFSPWIRRSSDAFPMGPSRFAAFAPSRPTNPPSYRIELKAICSQDSSSTPPSKRSSREVHPPSRRPPPPPASRRIFSFCRAMLLSPRAACLAALILVVLLTVSWKSLSAGVVPTSDVYTHRVVEVYRHDPAAFTQGLLYVDNDTLYESTGLYNESSVRKVHLPTGKVLRLRKMDGSVFGEGLTLLNNRLFQVTWLTRTGFIYDLHNLNQIGRFTHQMTDGWGLATDGHVIYGSDGTSSLYQMDPRNFKVMKKVTVRFDGSEVSNVNELEYIKGEIWANIWLTDCIARISPEDGNVSSWILLHNLRRNLTAAGFHDIDVLNGIAWDKVNDRIFVTGKWWPKLYEIKLEPVTGTSNRDIKLLCNIG